MKINYSLVTEGGGGAGGAGTVTSEPWFSKFPDEIKNSSSIGKFKGPDELAKSYLELEKMVGADKVALPGKDAKPEAWDAVWNKLGRPESPDKYGMPDVKPIDGVVLDEEMLKATRASLHKAGLTDSQAKAVLGMYLETKNREVSTTAEATKLRSGQAMEELKKEYGPDKVGMQIDMAKAALKAYGNNELIAALDESGFGDNPHLIKLLAKIGGLLSEDTIHKGNMSSFTKTSTQARQEIASLKGDKDFMDALNSAQHAGHKEAVARWTQLHQQGAAE